MNDYSKFAVSYAFLFQSAFLDTEANDWYGKVFASVKDSLTFQDLQDMLNRLPLDTHLYRSVRQEILVKASNPEEKINVVVLTNRGSKEEIDLVKQITELAKEGDEADQAQIKEMVRKRIDSLNGDLKGRMRRLFKEII